MSGWFIVHRGYGDKFPEERYCRRAAWLWLIENVNWRDKEMTIKGEAVVIPRGSIVVTERQLASAWGWTRQEARTFLDIMASPASNPRIIRTLTRGLTTISLTNFDSYQKLPVGDSAGANQESSDSEAPARSKSSGRLVTIPDGFPFEDDLDRARKYWRSRGRSDLDVREEAMRFSAHHSARGTKSKSWSSSWTTWYANAVKFNEKKVQSGFR